MYIQWLARPRNRGGHGTRACSILQQIMFHEQWLREGICIVSNLIPLSKQQLQWTGRTMTYEYIGTLKNNYLKHIIVVIQLSIHVARDYCTLVFVRNVLYYFVVLIYLAYC